MEMADPQRFVGKQNITIVECRTQQWTVTTEVRDGEALTQNTPAL